MIWPLVLILAGGFSYLSWATTRSPRSVTIWLIFGFLALTGVITLAAILTFGSEFRNDYAVMIYGIIGLPLAAASTSVFGVTSVRAGRSRRPIHVWLSLLGLIANITSVVLAIAMICMR